MQHVVAADVVASAGYLHLQPAGLAVPELAGYCVEGSRSTASDHRQVRPGYGVRGFGVERAALLGFRCHGAVALRARQHDQAEPVARRRQSARAVQRVRATCKRRVVIVISVCNWYKELLLI